MKGEFHMGETSKSRARRLDEGWYDKFIFQPGIDIGCQRDSIDITFRRWDYILGDTDAQFMEGVPADTFQTVYCSHLLEHINDPVEAISNWFRILKPMGHLVICVPHRDLYEKKEELPSNWNLDHKFFWIPESDELPNTRGLRATINVALEKNPYGYSIEHIDVLNKNYVANGILHPGGEYSIEAIIRKASLPFPMKA